MRCIFFHNIWREQQMLFEVDVFILCDPVFLCTALSNKKNGSSSSRMMFTTNTNTKVSSNINFNKTHQTSLYFFLFQSFTLISNEFHLSASAPTVTLLSALFDIARHITSLPFHSFTFSFIWNLKENSGIKHTSKPVYSSWGIKKKITLYKTSHGSRRSCIKSDKRPQVISLKIASLKVRNK